MIPDNATDDAAADQIAPKSESFIVKVWSEDTATPSSKVTWRGYVTHVFSGKRGYVRDLDDITDFIVPYLQALGVTVQKRWRLRQWVKARKSARPKKGRS